MIGHGPAERRALVKRLISLFFCLSLLLALSGCGGKKGMAFTAVLPGDLSTLDPQIASGQAADMVLGSIFEGLCRIDAEGNAAPGVAEKWEHNETCTEFTFHLRAAYWSDGSPVTADDFLFGIQRALRPETGSPSADDLFIIKNARAIRNGELEESALGVSVQDDRTLVITLETGFADFPLLTAGNRYMPCSRAYFEESAGHYGLSAGYLLTNGPFTFSGMYAWNTDYNQRGVSLVRSETYRGKRDTVAGSLAYRIDYDETIDTDPAAALGQELVDILPTTEEAAASLEEQGCRILALEDGVTGLLLNPQSDALSYAGTRELFIRTLDRENLLESRRNAVEALGLMPACIQWDGQDYYADGTPRYALQDDNAAQSIPSLLELLELESVPAITVLCPDDEASIATANGFLVSWNAKLGTAFNILPLPENQMQSRIAQGDYDAALYTLRAGGVTPYNVLRSFESGASPTLLASDEYDAALHSSDFTLDSYRDLEGMLREKYVFYPLFQEKSYYALAPGVTGVAVSPDLRLDFSQARKA